MAWIVLAEGATAEELQASAPDIDLPAGTKMKMEITTTIPIAPFFNTWAGDLIEGWAFQRLLDADAEVTNVEGEGSDKIVVYMTARGAWIWAVVIGICALCAYFGWQWMKEIRLFAEKVSPVVWGIIGIIAASIAVPLVVGLLTRRKEA